MLSLLAVATLDRGGRSKSVVSAEDSASMMAPRMLSKAMEPLFFESVEGGGRLLGNFSSCTCCFIMDDNDDDDDATAVAAAMAGKGRGACALPYAAATSSTPLFCCRMSPNATSALASPTFIREPQTLQAVITCEKERSALSGRGGCSGISERVVAVLLAPPPDDIEEVPPSSPT